jgi:hypothetical protein
LSSEWRGEPGSFSGEEPLLGALREGYCCTMGFLLWLAAVVLVIAGIVILFKGSIILGIVLIVVGFAVGPGGWSVIKRR